MLALATTGLVVQGISSASCRLAPMEKLALAVVRPGSLTMPRVLKVSSVLLGGMAMRP